MQIARSRWLVLIALIYMLLTTAPALGATRIELARAERAATAVRITEVKDVVANGRQQVKEQRRLITKLLGKGRHQEVGSSGRAAGLLEGALADERKARRRAHQLESWAKIKLQRLKDRWQELDAWLYAYGVFESCPVPAFTHIADDFGQMVRLKKVPVHRHQGSDISAPAGSPIVAPFDGYAWTSWSKLGGREVRVRGERGYVYNAHLAAVGRLGDVKAGDVIGYVGSTGDATGPHNHLEWHPWNGPARDPYAYLVAACVDV